MILLAVGVALVLGLAATLAVRLLTVTKERDRARDQLEFARSHDPLTGLPRRAMFVAALDEELSTCSTGALLILDVEGVAAINDAHGHDAGDAALVAVAKRLCTVVRADDDVARLSGGEFVVLLRTDPGADVLAIADRVLESACLREPHALTARIGMVQWDPDAPPPPAAELLRAAERAMSPRVSTRH